MKIILLLLFFVGETNCFKPTIVYICASKSGKKYHLKATCKGLSHCSHQIVRMTLEEAKKNGKTHCLLEK